MVAAPSAQLTTPDVSADEGLAPPEIVRLRRRGRASDYYQALSGAAQVRLRLLVTLHARGELESSANREASRQRLAAQQTQVWQQLQWLIDEMRRMDELDQR